MSGQRSAGPRSSVRAMRIDLSRGMFRTWAAGVLATGFFGTVAALAAIYPDRFLEGDSPATRVMAWLCTVLFLAPLVFLLVAARKMLARQELIIDAAGITPIAWQELAAVGIAHRVSPLAHPDKAITRGGPLILELFPQPGVRLDGRLDGLIATSGPPPRHDLPRDRYGLVLPALGQVPARIEQAVTAYASQLWLGSYPRQTEPSDRPPWATPPGDDDGQNPRV